MSFEPHWINTPPQMPDTRQDRRRGRSLPVVLVAAVAGLLAGVVGGAIGTGLIDDSNGSSGAPLITAPSVDPAKVGDTAVAKAAAEIGRAHV